MKLLTMALLSLIVMLGYLEASGPAFATESEAPSDEIYIPKNLSDSFDDLKRQLRAEDIDQMRSGTEADMIEYHFGLGRVIRNRWGLFGGSRLSTWFNTQGLSHPDDMSGVILTSFWRHLNDQPIELEQQIKTYQDYWKKQK